MRTAYEKGYNVVTLTDCTAAMSQEEQEFACAKNFPMFSRPLTHTEFLGELTGSSKASDKTRGYEAAESPSRHKRKEPRRALAWRGFSLYDFIPLGGCIRACAGSQLLSTRTKITIPRRTR